MGDADLLRTLHDTYVWEVNAAVAEGRMDLVWQLADEYTDEALRLMTAQEPGGCGREDCAVCARLDDPGRATPRAPAPPVRRWGFWRRHRRAR